MHRFPDHRSRTNPRRRPLRRVSSSYPRATVFPLVVWLATACSADSPDEAEPPELDPMEAFQALERSMLDAAAARVDFTVTSEGFIEVDLEGSLVLGDTGQARLEAQGTWQGDEVSVLLASNGQRMRMTDGTDTTETATPPSLREALVIGLTRMGILHNLARLTGLAPPDHADGGVREWVEVVDLRLGEGGGVGFDIHVAGQRSGSANLFLAPGTSLPGERGQTVEFPDGTMEVRELYDGISLGATVDPAVFELD